MIKPQVLIKPAINANTNYFLVILIILFPKKTNDNRAKINPLIPFNNPVDKLALVASFIIHVPKPQNIATTNNDKFALFFVTF